MQASWRVSKFSIKFYLLILLPFWCKQVFFKSRKVPWAKMFYSLTLYFPSNYLSIYLIIYWSTYIIKILTAWVGRITWVWTCISPRLSIFPSNYLSIYLIIYWSTYIIKILTAWVGRITWVWTSLPPRVITISNKIKDWD